MSDFFEHFDVIQFVGLVLLAYFTGRWAESRHYRSIRQRERVFLNRPAITAQTMETGRIVDRATLVVGSVVVSVDYFKRFLAGFRMLFGGELGAYAPLLDRGKREAILRMKESCPEAQVYLNCRLETSPISRGQGESVGCVEIVAYGTAIIFRP